MSLTGKMKIIVYTLLCLIFYSSSDKTSAQTYSFRTYGEDRNIPNSFIYTIDQSDDGYLWIGTGSGISRFDGFEFFNVPFPDSVTGRYPATSYKDSSGKIWYGCSDGTLFFSENRRLVKSDIDNTSLISAITKETDGQIFVITQGSTVFAVNTDDKSVSGTYSVAAGSVIFSGCLNSTGEILLGTQENLLVCRPENDSLTIINIVEGFDYAAVTAIFPTDDPSVFIVGTDGNGIFRLTMKEGENTLERFSGFPTWNNLSVQSINGDRSGNIVISTYGSGVIQFSLDENNASPENVIYYNAATGLITDDIKTFYNDTEGNYWFGTFGSGLSVLTSYAFSFYVPGKNSSENNIIYIGSLRDKYFLGTPSGYHLFDAEKGSSASFTELYRKTQRTDITSYHIDQDENIWVGTAGAGLFLLNNRNDFMQFFRSGDSGSDNVRDIEIDDRNIWLATINGVIVLDKRNGDLVERFDIANGLPHSSINTIQIDTEGRALIGNNEGERLLMIDRNYKIIAAEGVMAGSTINRIQSFSLGKDDNIWISTRGNGVFRLANDSVFPVERSGELLSNYCYSIHSDKEHFVWVGHEKGFSRINTGNGAVRTFGSDYTMGGSCNNGAMYESEDHKLFIGTTGGIVVYDRNKDNLVSPPPITNLNYIIINDKRYDYQPVYVLPYKKYIIRINFVGINFSDPDKVYYSTYVDEFDESWSKLSREREIPYSLGDGKYKFNILSVNQDGSSQKDPLTFTIHIKKPWWRTWWAILGWIVILAGAVIVIIRIREESHKKVQVYLETELEARTSEVVKQKGEIELQNIEITDSINYAKRIQTSILPDFAKVQEAFQDAFLFFKPRDIVSGDFYWFDRLDDERFILVCADSTGHGVPGAFMSMIGSTLLQDIVSRQRVSRPSEILTLLDRQIFSTLNQNIELGVSNDGMDMVVCEFNLKKRHVRFASAMRPVIVVLSGESYYIKGNRSAVGGESVMEKYFDDQEYYLNEGDSLYLFSDGLPDQFGGSDGKKLKIARLKKLIEQNSHKPMAEQKEIISKFYADWRGTYEQVDDILLIGVKV